MVYRRPYLTSGSSGFALNAISRTMKKELKTYIEEMRMALMDNNWKVPTAVCWGKRDRWLSYDGVKDFCKDSKHQLIQLTMVISIPQVFHFHLCRGPGYSSQNASAATVGIIKVTTVNLRSWTAL